MAKKEKAAPGGTLVFGGPGLRKGQFCAVYVKKGDRLVRFNAVPGDTWPKDQVDGAEGYLKRGQATLEAGPGEREE